MDTRVAEVRNAPPPLQVSAVTRPSQIVPIGGVTETKRLVARIDETAIDAIFDEYRQSMPGVAVGVAIGGVPVYRKGFGVASLESGVGLDAASRIRIFSVSKQFTALGFLLLCEDGRVCLDEPIGSYLAGLTPSAAAVTARHLLGNVSGLIDSHDLCYQFGGLGQRVTSDELLGLYFSIDAANFPARTGWAYNNGGFLLISAIIERVTGQSLEVFLWERIFAPLGMYDTALCRRDDAFVARNAAMHSGGPGSFRKASLGPDWAGEGGIVSTVDDMLRWLAHMDEPAIGSAESWRLMTTPLTLANGTSTGYGLGLIIGSYRGARTIGHSGGGFGPSAQMTKVESAGLDIMILSNRDDRRIDVMANAIIDAAVAGLDEPARIEDDHRLTGHFHSQATGRTVLLRKGEGENPEQIAEIDGQTVTVAWDDGVLRPSGGFDFLEQSIAPAGGNAAAGAIIFTDFGTSEVLEAVEARQASALVPGRYQAEGGLSVELSEGVDATLLRAKSPFGLVEYALDEVGPSLWKGCSASASFVGGLWESLPTGDLAFTNYRTKRFIFRKRNRSA